MLKSPIYSGNTTFELSSKMLKMSAENVEWNVRWPAIERVVNASEGVFFYAGMFTYVLPKSVLADGQDAEIWDAIENWRGKDN